VSGGCISIISISSERSLEILVCVFGFSGHRIGFTRRQDADFRHHGPHRGVAV